MNESAAELAELQELIDDSVRRASPSLRASFGLPEQSLSAAQLVQRCAGVFQVVLATVTASGAPRCAPVGALIVGGKLYVPTGAQSHRARNLTERPALSLSLSAEDGFALIVHGTGRIMDASDPEFAAVEEAQFQARGTRVSDWGNGVFIAVEAESLFTYARDPAGNPA
ncbi:pyridoxamine 5'-phosphate oxidase family protein [Streptomyces acidiscabies]|uniref:Pyridoxamine 5'-phosphate oxidase family protein n=1 Tax=Streptomyces acidiscabies TaxID=42234 RepID=A0AAP6BFQ1_9ACTN|nr:pyridoxamine 5'-phosphate oxidase family protein [Streptomyces acidiscabies]MBP5937355.1 pyridoxamine 5'-phosphate oxidase family protein [Streptomyces sp. LBUM 1476]MBZ3914577.1 pyridoxamine 5'-phosphate oxidase family protein [Streptomyces acidiscabies]MDX2963913.1 pyridoxamine 5'-phosphate oxidase family protein [Streptomyces acidiscabies]MDX3017265.1 pyridoxamine 5'-phosphate oxidase family protein [Streptomyces acidiscabies]MDX3789216.1 pyridoxamine 5'-phosphate oxidase family protein 